MNSDALVLLAPMIPLLAAVLIAVNRDRPNVRDTVALVAGVALLATVLSIVPDVVDGARPSWTLLEMLPGLAIRFEVEPLGMMFAGIASLLWPLSTVYSVGYMRGNNEQDQTRFYVFFAIAIASAVAIAFAANLLTLFVCYEILSVSTYPLVTHKRNAEAMKGGRTYLGLLLGTSIGFLFPAIIWTWWTAGTIEFTPGGVFDDAVATPFLGLLLALYMFGIGKAALMPFHRWLPAAMVAPTPVSALLHAVAVVKAGVFSVMKVLVYIFGIDLLDVTGASDWLTWAAAITLLLASLVAMTKDNLKARLAYSTVSQLSYVILGGALATSMGVIGGSMHIAMHAMGKITLFFCAGAIYTATHKTEISQMDGLGRVMPFTYAAFLIGALSVIGLPPMGGSWSKWFLLVGAADAQQMAMIVVLLASSLLNVAYLVPVAARGFFRDGPAFENSGHPAVSEAPLFCVIPLCITAAGCVLLFFYADALYTLLSPIAAPQTTP
jgi:multicomponent Na+:H+ antiporter subunit D